MLRRKGKARVQTQGTRRSTTPQPSLDGVTEQALRQGQRQLFPKRIFTSGDPAEIRRRSAGDPAMTCSFSDVYFSPCSRISAEVRPEILDLRDK